MLRWKGPNIKEDTGASVPVRTVYSKCTVHDVYSTCIRDEDAGVRKFCRSLTLASIFLRDMSGITTLIAVLDSWSDTENQGGAFWRQKVEVLRRMLRTCTLRFVAGQWCACALAGQASVSKKQHSM